MNVSFDSLNNLELPMFFLCNPGCKHVDGALTNVVGVLYGTTDEEVLYNFNTTSELNFRIYQEKSSDKEISNHLRKMYQSVQNRRMVYIKNFGFFIVTNVDTGMSNGMNYKDVHCESCEIELSNKTLPFIEDNTYKFDDLLELVVSSVPMWKIGYVHEDVSAKYRTFSEVDTEQNVLSFFLENMQDAYECIFVFDIDQRLINVYDQNDYVKRTSIHITQDDVINEISITENSDELYTAINVLGHEDLTITPVNPLGTNIVYNFNYYLDWMTDELRESVKNWQDLVTNSQQTYYDLNLDYYKKLTKKTELEAKISEINTQITMYQRCRDNIVAEGSTSTVGSYNEVIEQNGGVPIGIQDDIAATVAAITNLLANAEANLAATQAELDQLNADIEVVQSSITEIHNSVSISNYFSQSEYDELSNYIFEGSYRDEYVSTTSLMTYEEKFEQMKILYDRAMSKLVIASSPTQEFSTSLENFVFSKTYEEFSKQLEVGSLVNVDIGNNEIAELFLSNITINYQDKSLSLTFGNRFNRFDPKAIFNSVLGDIKKSTNSINYIKEVLYPIKNGEFDKMKEAIETSGTLTKNEVIASKNQEFVIDDTGIAGKKLLENGEYDPKQIKITNQTIAFTDDAWETAKTAIGSFKFYDHKTGEVSDKYGVIADTIVGDVILSSEVGVYNEDNSVTIDQNGIVMTADGVTPGENRTAFIIQKKITNDSGEEELVRLLYVDDNGELVLNGTIRINSSASGDFTLDEVPNEETIAEQVREETSGIITEVGDMVISETQSVRNDLNDRIDSESQTIYNAIDSAVETESVNIRNDLTNSFNSTVGTVKNEIDEKYGQIQQSIDTQINDYKAEVGQYLQFDEGGLTLGSSSSDFKTVIDNNGLYFKQGSTIVSYVNNNQLHIPNAVIEKTMVLGRFFFSPREDGGVSLTWQ